MKTAFTLIELLVVITIIVVLLAMLAPALDQAMYQAELAVCAAKQDALAVATVQYTMGHKRFYPYRKLVQEFGRTQTMELYRNPPASDMAVFRSFLSLNDNLQDPLVQPVDLTILTSSGQSNLNDLQSGTVPQHTWVYSSYAYWAGWRYNTPTGLRGMRKVGDGFEWDGRSFRMIASDHDAISELNNWVQSKHPDADGVMYNQVLQNQTSFYINGIVRLTYSTWTVDLANDTGTTWRRGLIDMNTAFDDGSVARYSGVPADRQKQEDQGLTWVPNFSDALNYNDGTGPRLTVPRP
jgi:prepilin-type N-terminal cleavage/methylation domain-containing protein